MEKLAGVLLTAVAVAAALASLFVDELKGKKSYKYGILGFCGVLAVFGIYYSVVGLDQTANPSSLGTRNNLIPIDSQSSWQKTDFSIRRGDKVSISVEFGKWTAARRPLNLETVPEGMKDLEMYVHYTYETNGTGTGSSCMALNISGCPLPEEKWGKLVGRIGDEAPFAVGKNISFVASSSGPLQLTINDSDEWLEDNSGVLGIKVEIEKP